MAQRWAVLGYGMFGRHHARCPADCPGIELAAIASTSEADRAAARAAQPGVRVEADWRAVVAAPDLDAVAIVTPNHLHAEMALAALEAGKAVLIEKPLATTLADCDRLIEAARRTGRPGRPRFVRLDLFRLPLRPGSRGRRHESEVEEDHTPAASGELVELALRARATAAAFARGRPLVPAEDGRRAVEVALAIEEALRSGETVRLAEGASGRQPPGRQ